jgi:hypothetical protein
MMQRRLTLLIALLFASTEARYSVTRRLSTVEEVTTVSDANADTDFTPVEILTLPTCLEFDVVCADDDSKCCDGLKCQNGACTLISSPHHKSVFRLSGIRGGGEANADLNAFSDSMFGAVFAREPGRAADDDDDDKEEVRSIVRPYGRPHAGEHLVVGDTRELHAQRAAY